MTSSSKSRFLALSGIIISGAEDTPPAETPTETPVETPATPATPPPANTPKLVPESDLLAVKERSSKLEEKVKSLETDLSTSQTSASLWQNKIQDAEAQLATLKQQADSAKTVQQELDALKTKSEGDSKSLETSTKRTLDLTRDLISARYPDLDQAKYKDMSQSELDSLLKALEIVNPAQNGTRRFDGGNGSGAGAPRTGLEVAHMELEKLRSSSN
jgi:hypothetical protein